MSAAGTAGLLAQNGIILEILVVSADDARPLAGAEVHVAAWRARGTTDRTGTMLVRGLPIGTHAIEVSSAGFAMWSESVTLTGDGTTVILVELAPDPVDLEPVDVRVRASVLTSRGFYDRQRFGSGTFLTRADIERMRPRFLSDVLRRVGGINIGSDSRGMPPARIRGQQTIVGGCPIQYFVDGVLTTAYNIDEMRPDDVEGIEIYRGAATIPAMFKRGTAGCGVIVLWTKVEG